MRYLSIACLSLVILLLGCSTPPKTGVSISSFRVVETNPEFVELEIIASHDGSKETMCFIAAAKSNDGSVRSEGSYFPDMPAGQNNHIIGRVMRPKGLGKHQTDFLMVEVMRCGKETLLTQKFDWPYVWPEISTGVKSGENEDLGATNPWFALLKNLQDRDFYALDMLMDKWNRTKERDKNGAWKLDSFMSTLYYITKKICGRTILR